VVRADAGEQRKGCRAALVSHDAATLLHLKTFSTHTYTKPDQPLQTTTHTRQNGTLDVIGRVSLSKFSSFMEELRASRSRTVTIGIASPAPDADPIDSAHMYEAVRKYSSGGRIGRLQMAAGTGVEGYLIPRTGRWWWLLLLRLRLFQLALGSRLRP